MIQKSNDDVSSPSGKKGVALSNVGVVLGADALVLRGIVVATSRCWKPNLFGRVPNEFDVRNADVITAPPPTMLP